MNIWKNKYRLHSPIGGNILQDPPPAGMTLLLTGSHIVIDQAYEGNVRVASTGATLVFKSGGKFKNGTLQGNQVTLVFENPVQCVFENVMFNGTFLNLTINSLVNLGNTSFCRIYGKPVIELKMLINTSFNNKTIVHNFDDTNLTTTRYYSRVASLSFKTTENINNIHTTYYVDEWTTSNKANTCFIFSLNGTTVQNGDNN